MPQTEELPAELAAGLPAWARKKVFKTRLFGLYEKQMFFYNTKDGGNLYGLVCYFKDHKPEKIGEEYYQDSSGTLRYQCARCKCLMDICV